MPKCTCCREEQYISSSFLLLFTAVSLNAQAAIQRNWEREHSNVKFFWLNLWSISNANWQRMLFQHHLLPVPELPTTAIQLQLWVKASLLCCCWWYRLQDSHVIKVAITDIHTLYVHNFCLNTSFSFLTVPRPCPHWLSRRRVLIFLNGTLASGLFKRWRVRQIFIWWLSSLSWRDSAWRLWMLIRLPLPFTPVGWIAS